MRKSQKGFTLIELLIVIVIIGILAGVLIAVIDPASQQNRARDAGVQATINKVALAVEGFNSAYGRTPFDDEFLNTVQNSEDAGLAEGGAARCADTTDKICEFDVTGNSLLTTANLPPNQAPCAANLWNGDPTGSANCYYHYWGDTGGAAGADTHFRIAARSFGLANTLFVYDNKVGEISECDATGANQFSDFDCDANCANVTDGTPCAP